MSFREAGRVVAAVESLAIPGVDDITGDHRLGWRRSRQHCRRLRGPCPDGNRSGAHSRM